MTKIKKAASFMRAVLHMEFFLDLLNREKFPQEENEWVN